MAYLTVFVSAFLAATVVPLVADAALAAALAAGAALHWLVFAATLGSTLGSLVFWGIGRFFEGLRDRRWFPASAAQMARAGAWFRRYGVWSLLLVWIPGLGDALTVVAGAMRVGVLPVLILVALGKGGRYLVLALTLNGVVLPWLADPEPAQQQRDGIGAASGPDRVGRAGDLGELVLESFHLRPKHEPAAVDDPPDGRLGVLTRPKIPEPNAPGRHGGVPAAPAPSMYLGRCAR